MSSIAGTQEHPGVVALAGLTLALQSEQVAERHDFDAEQGEQAPPFRSGIRKLDQRPGCPGPYGVTALAGPPKSWKSGTAIGAALDSAGTLDWRVVYFNGELDESEFSDRVGTYLDAHPAAEDALGLLSVFHVGRGVEPSELVTCIEENPGQERVLVVLDSINTLANLSNRPYLDALREFSLWAMMARRISGGAASFLIVSETNARGGIKGEQLHFWADLVLRIAPCKEEGFVELEITHSRRTAAGKLGRFARHVASGELVHEDDLADRLRIVRGT